MIRTNAPRTFYWFVLFALLTLAAGWVRPGGAAAPSDLSDQKLTFEVRVEPGDPFDPLNKIGTPEAPPKVRRGETVRIVIQGKPKSGYHTYPVNRILPGQSFRSSLWFDKVKGLVPLEPLIESEPVRAEDSTLGPRLEYDEPFTWSQEFVVLEDAPAGSLQLPFKISTQICNERNCTPVNEKLVAKLTVADGAPIPLSPELAKRVRDAQASPAPGVVRSPGAVNGSETEKKAETESIYGLIKSTSTEYAAEMEALMNATEPATARGNADADLLSFLLMGVFWGAVSLITPCVFPMIPITVSYFLKQSEKEHHRPIVMAAVYSLTIVVVLTLAAAFLLSLFRWLSIHPVTNYIIGGLFIFFALSLFGMYEIELPNFLARYTSAKEGQGGLLGTFFMALTFTIISFACVAPFLGGFGGTAAAARPLWHNLLGGLAYSGTFAAPFFLLALFPALLRALPKSGSWLNSVKVVMGFLEIAASFKFFRAAELTQTAGAPSLFTFDLVLGIWVALCVLCGLYLLNLYRLPHDSPQESVGVPRLIFSIVFLALAFYLMPAMFKNGPHGASQRPVGAVYAWVDSFLLPEATGSEGFPVTANLPYAVAEARKPGKPSRIFLDVTGINCPNCRLNERNVFSRPEIIKLFQQYQFVKLYTDTVPSEFYTASFRSDLRRAHEDAVEVNAKFQKAILGTIELPMYAILEPKPGGGLRVLGVYPEFLISDQAAFAEFLRNPGGAPK